MPDVMSISAEIIRYFGTEQLPALFARMAPFEAYLTTTWHKYQAVMLSGEIERATKELMGLAIAVAKSNAYVIALQGRQVQAAGVEQEEQLEALAVADFSRVLTRLRMPCMSIRTCGRANWRPATCRSSTKRLR